MDESINFPFDEWIKSQFELEEVDVQTYSPLTLAYIGDCVYDLIIKTIIISGGNKQVQKLHKETSTFVQASAQSAIMRRIQPILTAEELKIYKRGRNAKSMSSAKNQSITDYRRATGFEALVGYLHLKKEWKRMVELIKIGLEETVDVGQAVDEKLR